MTYNKNDQVLIAIIGVSHRFPGGANTSDELWKICSEARNTWSEWLATRLNESAFHHTEAEHIGTVSFIL
jgi:acyl transferase domain-containing protein